MVDEDTRIGTGHTSMGEHTDAVLREFGFGEYEVAPLKATRAVR